MGQIGRDTFSRANVASGWGTGTDGQAWTKLTGNNTPSVASNEGVLNLPTGTTYMQIGTKTPVDAELRVRLSFPNLGDAGGVFARYSSGQNGYAFHMGSGGLQIVKIVNGVETILGFQSFSFTINTFYWLAFRLTGSTLQAKAWQDGTTEPTTWNLTRTDTTYTGAGPFGIFSNPSSFTTGIKFDSFFVQDGFVTRNNTLLKYNGSTLHFGGCNAWWLNWFTNQFSVLDALNTCVEMGVKVVRVKTAGNSQGFSQAYEPTQNSFAESALAFNDWTIYQAGLLGLKLILPFCDYFNNNAGWYGTFAAWNGVANSAFWTDANCLADYKNYISHLLNHVNSYNGLAYWQDSTILAWESMNEPQTATIGASTLATWTQAISSYVKSIDANHLFQDGANSVNTNNLTDTNTDIFTNHYYPPTVSTLNFDLGNVSASNKVFYIGEYDWTGLNGGDALSSILAAIEGNANVAGDCFWDLSPHKSAYGWDELGNRALYYPSWTTTTSSASSEQDASTNIRALRTHAYTMSGISPAPVDLIPPAPTQVQASTASLAAVLQWQGSVGALKYDVEVSTTSAASVFSVVATVNDWQTPINNTPGAVAWYRVRAYNFSNTPGAYSSVVRFDSPPTIRVSTTRRDRITSTKRRS
jgi:hypothetical protein